jgi:hypothetical protein
VKEKEPNNPFFHETESPVPIPPVEDAWQAMRKRLDEEMPDIPSSGSRKRWMLLLLLLLLSLGVFRIIERPGRSAQILSLSRKPAATAPVNSVAPRSVHSAAPAPAYSVAPKPAYSSDRHDTGVQTEKGVPEDQQNKGVAAGPQKAVAGRATPNSKGVGAEEVGANSGNEKERVYAGTKKRRTRADTEKGRIYAGTKKRRAHAGNEKGEAYAGNEERGTYAGAMQHGQREGGVESGRPNRREGMGQRNERSINGAVEKSSIDSRLAQIAGGASSPFTVANGRQFDQAPFYSKINTSATQKIKQIDGGEKSNKPKDARRGERAGILYAAGLAESQSFPVGSQQQVDYNANLKKSLWSDYIPSPYFQFYPGRKIALQAAIQFNNPQYTGSVDIYRKEGLVLPGGLFRLDTLTQVKKLYYFNIPLTIYYSPLRNLYLGAGLQFSNLRNGVGLQNNVIHYVPGGNLNYNNSTAVGPGGTNIKIDSVTGSRMISLKENGPAYNNLKKADWRVLFEVNYYWKRVSLGLQFQEALEDYLRTPVEGSSGNDRNSSFSIYIRYNLWERRSRPTAHH